MKIINPLEIKRISLPIIVFSDDVRGFFGWLIKNHTKGNYNHVMIMINPGKVVTQGASYKEIPITHYMKGKHRLKFFQPDLDGVKKLKMIEAAEKDLAKPFYRKWYDWPATFGQFIGVKWIQSPWQNFCSEVVAKYLRMFYSIFKRPSPMELNKLCEKIEGIKYYGHWMKD